MKYVFIISCITVVGIVTQRYGSGYWKQNGKISIYGASINILWSIAVAIISIFIF